MNNKISVTIAFGLGAAIGSVVTWKLVKTTYERYAQEEINSVKEVYSQKLEEIVYAEPEQPAKVSEDDRVVVTNILNAYTSSADDTEKGGSNIMELGTPPVVISPDEYGDIDDYDIGGLTYYDDGVLTDDADEPIENIEDYVPKDFAAHFGEFEDDAVHVRNHRLKIDYEILRDHRDYYDIKNSNLSPSDDE